MLGLCWVIEELEGNIFGFLRLVEEGGLLVLEEGRLVVIGEAGVLILPEVHARNSLIAPISQSAY